MIAIETRHKGNLGNRMIQHLGAKRIQTELRDAVIINSGLPELGVKADGPFTSEVNKILIIEDPLHSFGSMIEDVRKQEIQKIVIDDYMQRLDWLPTAVQSREIFPNFECEYLKVTDNDLLINIRASELTTGILHYPLVPVEFYQKIVEVTRLNPVFMGQIGDNAYCKKLLSQFPDARFVASQGARSDFETIRNAKNIVIAISTFSWLAAWLSNAEQIFVPIMGWLHPTFFPNGVIDLLPSDDPRYRFILFPWHYGMPEDEALSHQYELAALCKEIPAAHVNFLRKRVPIIKIDSKKITHYVNEIWYCNQYKSAALEIAEGLYENANAHYTEIGRRRGLLPAKEITGTAPVRPGLIDYAIGHEASQSSVSDWSFGFTRKLDAQRAIDGVIRYPYAFHTSTEDNPWWQVDLGRARIITCIIAINRSENKIVLERARPIFAAISLDGELWETLCSDLQEWKFQESGAEFNWVCSKNFSARFVRLNLKKHSSFHLSYVGVFGPTNA